MLEKTEGAIMYVQSRETSNIRYTRRIQTKHNTENQKDEQEMMTKINVRENRRGNHVCTIQRN